MSAVVGEEQAVEDAEDGGSTDTMNNKNTALRVKVWWPSELL